MLLHTPTYRMIGAAAVALLLVTSAEAAGQEAAPAAPDTITMGGPPIGVVTFTHAKHQDMLECVACHHESKPAMPATAPYQPCDVCHTKSPEPPVTTSLRDAFHDKRGQAGLCIDCHKQEAETASDPAAIPVRCNTCHIR